MNTRKKQGGLSSDNDRSQPKEEKIKALQEMIATAEQTIMSAKQMLQELQAGEDNGTKPEKRSSHVSSAKDGQVIMGTFDGQVMIGEDGKQYPVPANYASKSKLVEGDTLKLTITREGNFIYKQIGPIERRYLIGIVKTDERGNHIVEAEGRTYKVLLAAATYFKIEEGNEVTLVVPRDKISTWGAIENVLRKAEDVALGENIEEKNNAREEDLDDSGDSDAEEAEEGEKKMSAIERLEKEIEEERKKLSASNTSQEESLLDEWVPDIEELKKEASHPVGGETE
jgi:hypothetical protein